MGRSALYDDDILLWSEQQAEVIRRLGSRRDLPDELDLENVAEEIESVGRSELAAVESQLQNVLVHLLKMAVEPNSDSVRHWNVEIVGFHGELRRRYAPSTRQRIEFDQLWSLAREIIVLASDRPAEVEQIVPERSPFDLDDLLLKGLDVPILVRRIQSAGSGAPN